MPKINEYPQATSINPTDVFVVETATGTCKCSFGQLKIALLGVKLLYSVTGEGAASITAAKLVLDSNETAITNDMTIPTLYLDAETQLSITNSGSSDQGIVTVTSGSTQLLSSSIAADTTTEFALNLSNISDDVIITINMPA